MFTELKKSSLRNFLLITFRFSLDIGSPSAMDISLLRNLKRFAVDIDRVITKVRTIGSGLVGPLDPKNNLVPSDLYHV